MKRILTFVIALSFVGVIGCAKDLVTGKKTLNYYSLKGESKLGSQVLHAQMKAAKRKKKKMDAEADPVEYKRLKKIVKNLKPVMHHPTFPYEVHLMEIDVPNAWCAPGGKMMVYTGLWDPKKGLVEKGNEDQLAAVMAHEMAHANARHVTEAISKLMTIMVAGTAAQSAIGAGTQQGANIFGEVFVRGMNVYVPFYSRGNEYEADRLGLIYMAKAGYDPREAVKLWKKAAKKKKIPHTIYASHPSSGARARHIEKFLPDAMNAFNEAKANCIGLHVTKRSCKRRR